MSCRRVTLSHAGALEQVHSILALRQEEALHTTRGRDPKEVMKIPEICHSKFRVKELGGASKKQGRRGYQDDVVDVEQQVGNVGTHFVNKEGRIRGQSSEARLLDEAREPLVPRPVMGYEDAMQARKQKFRPHKIVSTTSYRSRDYH